MDPKEYWSFEAKIGHISQYFENVRAFSSLGVILFRIGKTDLAIKFFGRSMKMGR